MSRQKGSRQARHPPPRVQRCCASCPVAMGFLRSCLAWAEVASFFFLSGLSNERTSEDDGWCTRCRTGGPWGRRMPAHGRSRPFQERSRIRDCASLRLSALRFWKGSSLSAGEEPFRHLYARRRAVSVPRLTYFNVSLHRSHARGVVAPMKSSILRARLLVGHSLLQKGLFCAHLPFGGQREGVTSQARASSISVYAMEGREKQL